MSVSPDCLCASSHTGEAGLVVQHAIGFLNQLWTYALFLVRQTQYEQGYLQHTGLFTLSWSKGGLAFLISKSNRTPILGCANTNERVKCSPVLPDTSGNKIREKVERESSKLYSLGETYDPYRS